MAYDGIMMHQVIDDLNKTITGGRINKIYQISKYELLIQVRNNRTNYTAGTSQALRYGK